MSKGNSRNRHGIPLRGGEPKRPRAFRQPPKCIWPDCPGRLGNHPSTKLCNEHAAFVALEVDKARRWMQDPEQYIRDEFDEQPKPEPVEREEMIYYVEYAEHIKIGWTTNLERRLKRNFKPGGVLLAVHPGSRADEAKLHKRFAAYRTHGKEWYGKMPSLVHHIDLVKKEHGEPPALTIGPDPVGIPQPREKQYVGGPNNGYLWARRG